MSDPAGPYSIGSDWWPGLSKLIEELGELGQVLGKLIATNGDVEHWDGHERLDGRLADEMGDVYAALQFVLDHCPVDSYRVVERCRIKGRRFDQWHREQVRR